MDTVANVVTRNLIQEEHRPSDILREHYRYCELEREIRHFKGPVLAYVTPVSLKATSIPVLFVLVKSSRADVCLSNANAFSVVLFFLSMVR